jgi:hypothetical protein
MWANFQIIIELFTKKIVTKLSKIWVWDSGSGKNLFQIPDPGVKKAPDPGSATLAKSINSVDNINLYEMHSLPNAAYFCLILIQKIAELNNFRFKISFVKFRFKRFLSKPIVNHVCRGEQTTETGGTGQCRTQPIQFAKI